MKCISLWNPWAFLMAIDKKRNETRSWGTSYRGPLAIHAAKKWDKKLLEMCCKEPFYSALASERPNMGGSYYFDDLCKMILPFGQIIAVVDLWNCYRIETTFAHKSMLSLNEYSFGDYSVGRYVWQTQNVKRLREPIPFKGKQRFFEVPDELVRQAS